jgi:hypothetical protein
MSSAGTHVEAVMESLRKRFGKFTQFGRSKRLFQFGTHFTCSINYSRELRGPKFFYGLSMEVTDKSTGMPTTSHGHYVLLVCGGEQAVLWLPRSLVLQAMQGVTTRKLDVFQEDGRYILQTTRNPKLDVTEFLNASPTESAAEKNEAEPSEFGRSHSEIQIALAKLGKAEGCRIWVPPGDRNISWKNEALRDLTCDRLPNFGFDESTRRVVGNIDVLWLDGNIIRRAFEVEATTSIYSGLLRLNDLILAQPNNRINLVIGAESTRKRRVLGQLLRPTFSALTGQCSFVSFETVRKAVEQVDDLNSRGVIRVQGLLKYESLDPAPRAIVDSSDIRM